MPRQAIRAWLVQISGEEFNRCSYVLLVCSVNRLNAPLMEHIDDLFNIGTSLLVFLVLHGASSGMHHVDLHLLQTIQLFQHSLIFGRVFITAVAEEEGSKRYIFVRIAGKRLRLIVPRLQTSRTSAGLAGIQATQNSNFLHYSYSAAKTSGYRS